MRNLLFCVAIVLLLSAACAPPAEPPAPAIDLAAERSALIEADKAWYETFSSSETPVDAFLSGMVDDARFQMSENPPAHGKDEIRPLLENMTNIPGFTLSWTPTAAEVSSGGDLGYTVGTYEMNMEVDGNPVTVNGHYVTIWKKQEDGTWKVVLDGGGPSAPPGSP
jgi:ketosteroid isomerase-like protein